MSSPSLTKYPALPAKLILTSTKAYFSPACTVHYLQSLLGDGSPISVALARHSDHVRLVYIPDFIGLYSCSQILHHDAQRRDNSPSIPTQPAESLDPSGWSISLGAQNVYPSSEYGAFTGEITAPSLSALGVTIVEINHAERRRYLHENDDTAARKARVVSAEGMVPLLCIGELNIPNLNGPLSMSVGKALSELKPQIHAVLSAIEDPMAPVIFAYEPVWAIGAAEPAGVDYVGPVVESIRSVAKDFVHPGTRKARTGDVKVVYGGSAGPGLWSGKTNGGNGLGKYVDGLFLGRFAHEIEGVRKVVEEVVESLDET